MQLRLNREADRPIERIRSLEACSHVEENTSAPGGLSGKQAGTHFRSHLLPISSEARGKLTEYSPLRQIPDHVDVNASNSNRTVNPE